MDKLANTIRLYQRIMPDAQKAIDSVTLHRLRVWLSDDVATLVEGFSRRPSFRERAVWPVRALRAESDSAERRVIDALELALVNSARAYAKLLKNKRILTQLKHSFPPRLGVIGESIEVSGSDQPRILSRQAGSIDEFAVEASQLQDLCNRGRASVALVNIEDFFEPRQEFVLGKDGKSIQLGTHIVSLTPELHPVGNFILQSATRRLETHLQLLTSVRSKTAKAIRILGRSYRDEEAAQVAWDRLQKQAKAFRQTFQSGQEVGLRDACIILTQIYAAFHPAPNLEWLALPEQLSQEGQAVLQQRMHGSRSGELFERVVGALMELGHLYEDQDAKLSAREEAVARGDLVLVPKAHELYWECELLSFAEKSHRSAWKLLLPLITKASRGGYVEERDVFDKAGQSRSSMPMRMQRLKKVLPVTLRKLILKGPEPRTYRLNFQQDRIYIA